MNRKECYEYIKTHNLKDEATKEAHRYSGNAGTNYTNLPTDVLAAFVEIHQKSLKKNDTKPAPKSEIKNNPIKALSRDECFNIIKKNNWKDVVKDTFGKVFSSVSTDNLNAFITNKNECSCKAKPENAPENKSNGYIDVECRKVLKAVCIMLNNKKLAENL